MSCRSSAPVSKLRPFLLDSIVWQCLCLAESSRPLQEINRTQQRGVVALEYSQLVRTGHSWEIAPLSELAASSLGACGIRCCLHVESVKNELKDTS